MGRATTDSILVVLMLIAVVAILIGPGIVARLLFRRTSDVKLANMTALVATLFWFSRDDIRTSFGAFAKGWGSENLNVAKWFVLVLFIACFLLYRLLAVTGMAIGDKLLKMRNQKHIESKRPSGLGESPPK